MIFDLHHDHSPRLPLAGLLLLATLYLLTGVVGHDPWKGEDAIHLAIAHAFWQGDSLWVARIAGETWPHTPPLYHWVAALLGGLLSPLLPFHDGARLASPLFGALFLVSISGAARAFYGDVAGRIAPLLAIGTLGLLVSVHEAQPAVAGLAFAALAWWGGGLLLQGRCSGAWLLGVGAALAFATHGLVGLLMACTVLPAPTFCRQMRITSATFNYPLSIEHEPSPATSKSFHLKSLLLAFGVGLPLAFAWPLATLQTAPDFLFAWWQNEWAEVTLGRRLPDSRHLELLAWAAWPVLPLALWGWHLPKPDLARRWLPQAGILIGLAWFFSGPPRSLGLFPALIPLILLASAGAEYLRRGARQAFDWFAALTFSLIAVLIWLGASAITLGWPPAIARNFAKLAPGYTPDGSWLTWSLLSLAVVVTAGWLWIWRLPRAPWRSSLRWAFGATMMWVLVTTLWIGWIDHFKSYRPLALALAAQLPAQIGCIEREGLGTSQRAVLDYHASIRTVTSLSSKQCNWRIAIDDFNRTTPTGWTEVWRGGRSSDRKERWYLERREDDAAESVTPSESAPGNT